MVDDQSLYKSLRRRVDFGARRAFLRTGLSAFTGLTLADLFRLRATAGHDKHATPKSLLVVWLHGGASHLETYDPKPLAPSEIRGPFGPIETSVPGLQISELLPRQAKIAHQFTLVRSLVHTGFCHDDGPQQIFTGHPLQGRRLRPDHPDLFSITNYLRRDPDRAIPNYVGINPIPYLGSAYLGPAFESFSISGDPNDPMFEVPNIGLKSPGDFDRIGGRIDLRKRLDRMRREMDRSGNMLALDSFEAQAWQVLTGAAARKAFDINQEDDALRERYGRNRWGQQCLLARRLVEAGVELVTTTLNGPMCGRTGSWDDHAVNHHVFDAMQSRAPYFDKAVSTLIEDLHERGLDKHVLLIIGGDFGRTPRISYAPDSGSGVMQPGRDHWPSANSLIFSGGGIAEGQLIGATDRRGEQAVERRFGIGEFVATVYRHLGVDAERVAIPDFSGRPIPILQEGQPIEELLPKG
jgi:hypothetical protein